MLRLGYSKEKKRWKCDNKEFLIKFPWKQRFQEVLLGGRDKGESLLREHHCQSEAAIKTSKMRAGLIRLTVVGN